jgi:threonine dehydrogenase-like Zn-dependent dehydrogenase
MVGQSQEPGGVAAEDLAHDPGVPADEPRGADYSFEAVGRPELMVQAFDIARVEGTVTLVGMPPVGETLTLPAIQAVFSGKRLAGSVVGGAQILRFDLTGRVALVTGASSGLGEGLSRALASVGARVAVVARRHDRLINLAGEIGGIAIGCDLLDLVRVGEIVPRVADELGGPEILVNAAGNIFSHEPAEREPVEAMRQTLDLNLVAPFRLSQDVFPHMVAAGRGSIVNVSSISGRVGVPGIPQAFVRR